MATFVRTFGFEANFVLPKPVFISVRSRPINMNFERTSSFFFRPTTTHPLNDLFVQKAKIEMAHNLLFARLELLFNSLLDSHFTRSAAPRFNQQKPQAYTYAPPHAQSSTRKPQPSQRTKPAPAEQTPPKKNVQNPLTLRALGMLNVSNTKNPTSYELLGIPAGSDRSAIKKAYVAKSRQFHPDKYRGNDRAAAEEAFKLITTAYKALV